MSTEERFELLASELGPALEIPPPVATATEGDLSYTFKIDGEDEFTLTWLSDKESLVVRFVVGEVASVSHFRSLLAYNALHETTGGVRMGLDDTDQVVMTFETPVEELTSDRLRDYLLNLAGIAGLWRDVLAGDASLDQFPQSSVEPSDAVRV